MTFMHAVIMMRDRNTVRIDPIRPSYRCKKIVSCHIARIRYIRVLGTRLQSTCIRIRILYGMARVACGSRIT